MVGKVPAKALMEPDFALFILMQLSCGGICARGNQTVCSVLNFVYFVFEYKKKTCQNLIDSR